MTVISGSDIVVDNRSSLMSSRNVCCFHQFSVLPSTADMRFRCSTDLLYASTLTSGNANVTAGPHITVTNSVTPLISAKGSVLIAKLRSVNSGMPPSCLLTSSYLSIVSSSPVPKRFCCKRYWIRVCLRSLILFHESVDFFISNFLTLSLSSALDNVSVSSVLPSFRG